MRIPNSLLSVLLFASVLVGCAAPAATTVATLPSTSASEATTEPAVILTTGEWAPYTSETLEHYGAFTEIVSAVFAEMDVPVQYAFYPWKRAEEEVKNGKAFAVFPYIETDERLAEYDFSDPVMISTGKFFYMPKNQSAEVVYQQFADLQPYRIGGVLGYWYETPFKEAGLQVEYVSSDESNIQKLYLDRVDLVASDELVGWALIQKLYPQEMDQFATVARPMNEDSLRLLVSRQYPGAAELTGRFNTALKTLNERGVIQAILAKYGLK